MVSELRKYSVRLNEPVQDPGGSSQYHQEKSFGIPLDGGKIRVSVYRVAVHGVAGTGNQDVAFIALDTFDGVTVRDTIREETQISPGDDQSNPDLKRYVVADDLVARLDQGDNTSDVIATVTVEHFSS